MTVETLSLKGEPLPLAAAAPDIPMGPAPIRRPGSVRRTSTLDATWPEGRAGPTRLECQARDVLTARDGGAPTIIAEDRAIVFAKDRVLQSIEADPARPQLAELVGQKAGGHLREALDRVLHQERIGASPLYLVLDDLSGVTLIAGVAFQRWDPDSPDDRDDEERAKHIASMAGVCIGFRPGSSALVTDRSVRMAPNLIAVPPLLNPGDPEGWHHLKSYEEPSTRRARRIDLWREGGLIQVDASFQDSTTTPEGGRVAIHEYRLFATADAADGTLLSIRAQPHILPFRECPSAIVNIEVLAGTPMADLRATVLGKLRKTAGCTHLNDAARALAEVPELARHLPA